LISVKIGLTPYFPQLEQVCVQYLLKSVVALRACHSHSPKIRLSRFSALLPVYNRICFGDQIDAAYQVAIGHVLFCKSALLSAYAAKSDLQQSEPSVRSRKG
jgi:hypothetical protein